MSSPAVSRLPPPNAAGKAVTKVVWRCNDAQENQNLDLSECQLMSFPDAIYHLMRNTVLVACNLSSNVLRKIPPKFAIKFNNITVLNLSHNHLSTLPDELGNVSDLKSLDISHNSFFSVPKVVFKIPALTNLNAKKNLITEVNVLRLKNTPKLCEANFQENPLSLSCHKQLKELNSDKLNVMISDPTVDDTDSDFEDMESPSGSPTSN